MMKWWGWVTVVLLTAIALYGMSARSSGCVSSGGKMELTPFGAAVCNR